MKIWTLTTNDDNGTCTSVLYTEHDADNAAWSYLEFYWAEYHETKPMPDNWRVALDELNDSTGLLDYCHVEECDISDHPAIRGAIGVLMLAAHRLEMNNYNREEAEPTKAPAQGSLW